MIDLSEEYIFKTVVVGEGAVGKTSLVLQFTEKKFKESYIQTIGSNFALKSVKLQPKDISVKLQIWDLSGQAHFSVVRRSFYLGAQGAIYVYDVTRKKSLTALDVWKEEVDKHAPGIPAILLGNKIDLEDQIEVSTEEGKKMAEHLGASHFRETSAKTGEQVNDAFRFIAEKMFAVTESRGRKTR